MDMRRCTSLLCVASAVAMQQRAQLVLNSSASDHASDIFCFAGNDVGSWGAVEQTDSSKNLCIDDKLLPELYVLGAPKCATTSIYFDLANAGVQCAGGRKEFSFWRTNMDKFLQNPKPVKTEWLASMPSCSSEKGRQVVGDFSPGALGLGKRGSGPNGDVVGLPSILSTIYGGMHSRRITFVAMLREPLSRIHSQWYMTSDANLVSDFGSDFGPIASTTGDFRSDLDSWLHITDSSISTNASSSIEPTIGFEYMAALISSSQYGDGLEAWLEVFPASQFVVVPYRAYTEKGGGMVVCGSLKEKLNFEMNCTADVAHGLVSSSKNPPLNEDVSQDMRTRFDVQLAPDKSKLLRLLAEGALHGMSLPRFTHPDNVQQWLEKWW